MLNMNNICDRKNMMKYYRTSDMLNLLNFFPELSPIKDITIIENEEDFLNNKEVLNTFDQNRVDTLKGRPPINNIENSGKKDTFYDTLLKIKEKDPYGVLVLFNVANKPSERYERYAGISVGINLGENVIIDAVGKGFDGREVSKSICTHERYIIPWFELRKVNITNFKDYQTFKINNEDYQKTRLDRIKFLESIGIDPSIFTEYLPENYEPIPDFIWLSVIKNLLKKLEENEDILKSYGLTNFAISGHTEGKEFSPWQMFDKSRYTSILKNEII